ARAAAGADVEFAQAELIADLLGVHVLLAVDRVPAPADDQVRVGRLQHARVAQQAEHRVGDALAGVEVASALLVQLDRPVGQVAYRRRQQFGDAADDVAVDEGHRRGLVQVDPHPAVELVHLDVEVGIELLRRARVVGLAAAGEHGQCAAAQQVVHTTGGGVREFGDFGAGKDVQPAARVDARVDGGQGGAR